MIKKLLTFLVAVSFLGACQTAQSDEAIRETVTVTDMTGEKALPANPERVVVFDYGILDTLLALELETHIVGTVTNNAPAYLADRIAGFENVGTLKEPDIEKLITLQPDLIIISDRLADFTAQLEEIAPVLRVGIDQADYWGSIQANTQTVAKLFGVDAAAPLAALEAELQALKQATAASQEEKAMLLMLNDGAMSAFSTGSRFGYLFDVFGFSPVSEAIETSTHGQTIGYEGVLEINPDILFVIDRSQAVESGGESQMHLLDNDFIQKIEASQNNRIIALSPDLWYLSGGGLESTQLMIEEIAQKYK